MADNEKKEVSKETTSTNNETSTTKKRRRTRSTTSSKDWRKMMNLIAYVSVCIIGVCLLLGALGASGSVLSAFATIGNVLAYCIVAIGGWFYIRNRKNVWVWVVYFVALVMIIISYFI